MIVVETDPHWHVAFDALAWVGAASVAFATRRWRLQAQAQALAEGGGVLYGPVLAIGVLVGAFAAGALSGAPLSHSVVGALAGGATSIEIYKRVRGVEGSTGIIFAAPFAVGVAIGRWGCLFSGLADRTWGVATRLPWGVDLGDGVARHPVQVYESLIMAIFAAALIAGLHARHSWAMRRAFYWMVLVYGAQRFAWEFLKPYPKLIGPFNIFHLICVGLVIYGYGMVRRDRRRERTQGGPLPVLGPDHQPL